MRVHFTIPAEPIAQGRPRFSTHGKFVRAYDPKKSRDWKAFVADFARKAMDEYSILTPMEGPLCIRARFAFPLPKTQYRKRTPRKTQWHVKRPDLDNLFKGITDAMEGIVFHRDADISKVVMEKIIVAQGEAPYVSVVIEKLPADYSSKYVKNGENQS
tara:strand:+ start:181 stop:654 length:474 start_codon:yes stop_codon:yes gene_type:complete